MDKSMKILEFDKVLEKLEEFACTDHAKDKIKNLRPYLSEQEVKRALRDTTESRMILDTMGNPPLVSMEGIRESLHTAEAGGCLMPEQLEEIGGFLTAVKRLKDFLIRCKYMEAGIPYYEENLEMAEELREEIRTRIRGGQVDDYATKELKSIRLQIEQQESKMREKAEQTLRRQASVMADQFTTIKNGRVCVPVKKEFRSKVPGTVIDKSATGNTLFIEPETAGDCFDQIQWLKIDEENEVRKILYMLTDMTAEKEALFRNNMEMVEKLDFIFAKGKLSAYMDGTAPSVNMDRRITIKEGRHPFIDRKVNVPLNFAIGREDVRGIVITGPNTGGKTVSIKTVGLHCLMAQCGLHIPCEEADICLNDQVLCDIGDGQSLTENLSTFSAHITNVLDILRRADRDSLVIMDELGSGTDPAEGMGIAVAVLEELRQRGCLFLVTTHYPEVKNYAEKAEGIINARMAFDKETLSPLYRMEIGEAGESCAFYIAERLGMPEFMIARAYAAAYGTEENRHGKEGSFGKTLSAPKLKKEKKSRNVQERANSFHLGDSVMIFPDKKIGIVCKTANEKGVLCVQLQDRKIWINHKRIKLHVAAEELYPEDYDFSIIFESAENRKMRHQMERKYVEGQEIYISESGFELK